MKLLMVRFTDDVDLLALPTETVVTVSNGMITVSGKVLTTTAAIVEPEPLLPHTHPAVIGPATPS